MEAKDLRIKILEQNVKDLEIMNEGQRQRLVDLVAMCTQAEKTIERLLDKLDAVYNFK